jgi:LAS superfamily LD-carboxypeptidase LdcB
MNPEQLTGQTRSHIEALTDPPCHLHSQVAAPFLNMRRAARADGIELTPLSSFRSFERQLAIWNGKFSGERSMLDVDGRHLDGAALAPPQRVQAILLWSALPGASRHHWGSDLDLVDANAATGALADKLTRAAFAPGGPYAHVDRWLSAHAARFGFFRPFQGIRSGVQPEPWHVSFAPVAEKARRALSSGVLREALAAAPLLGKEAVLQRLDELHERYVATIDLP